MSGVEAVVLLAFAVYLMWYSTLPIDGLGAIALDLIAVGLLAVALAFVFAAFLLLRRGVVWRIIGLGLCGTLTATVVDQLVVLGQTHSF